MKQQKQVGKDLSKLAAKLHQQIYELEQVLTPYQFGNVSVTPDLSYKTDRKKIPFTSAIRKHPGFVWLSRQSEFEEAFQYFEERIEKRRLSEWPIALLKMKFLQYFAACGGWAFSDSNWQPREFSTFEKTRAVKIANELLTFVKDGLGDPSGPNYFMMPTLEDKLNHFVRQVRTDTNRKYSGPTIRQKNILIRLAESFRTLGLKQSEVVRLVDTGSVVLGFNPSQRTVQRYVSEAFSD